MKPRVPLPSTPATDLAIDTMTREQLFALVGQVEGHSVPAMARATDSALRGAARTYLRIGRLTAEQVLAVRYPLVAGDV